MQRMRQEQREDKSDIKQVQRWMRYSMRNGKDQQGQGCMPS